MAEGCCSPAEPGWSCVKVCTMHKAPDCSTVRGFRMRCRRRPTLPRPLGRSTIGAVGLNGRVRDGNGCGPYAPAAGITTIARVMMPGGSLCRRTSRTLVRELTRSSGSVVRGDSPADRVALLAAGGMTTLDLESSQAARAIRTAALGAGCPASTGGLSTEWSPPALQSSLGAGRVHLGGGFPLRCVQRLSPPAVATRRCPWQDSRDTSGQSDPVLSYWGPRPATLRRPRRIQTELSHDVLNPAHVPL